jgi:hypothetical protein
MRDPYRRSELMTPLEPKEVDKLEKKLGEKPEDVESRLRLLNHYRLDRSPEGRAAMLRHAQWVVENGPESNTAVRAVPLNKARDPEAYAKFKEIWTKLVQDSPDNAKIASNAARFCSSEDRVRAEALLKKAQELEPKNMSWTQQLAELYMAAALDPRTSGPSEAAKAALAQYESLLSQADGGRRATALLQAGDAALLVGDEGKAGAFGAQLLKHASSDDRMYGLYVHEAHRFLGHAALKSGDVAGAKAELVKAGKSPESMGLERSGPQLTLAKALLAKGEKEAVLAYLEKVAELWPRGADDVEKWSEAIRKGETPNLDRNAGGTKSQPPVPSVTAERRER